MCRLNPAFIRRWNPHQSSADVAMSSPSSSPLPRVLVTGGAGFLGSAVIEALIRTARWHVTSLDINPPSSSLDVQPKADAYVVANVLSRTELTDAFQSARPGLIVHTAGLTPRWRKRYSICGKERDEVFRVNVEGTSNVLDVARECGVRGLVFTSSITVVGDLLSESWHGVDESVTVGAIQKEGKRLAYGESKVWQIFNASLP